MRSPVSSLGGAGRRLGLGDPTLLIWWVLPRGAQFAQFQGLFVGEYQNATRLAQRSSGPGTSGGGRAKTSII
jgi:hypothetical protein